LDKFNFIIYSHQPIECLIPRQQSGQSRGRTTHPIYRSMDYKYLCNPCFHTDTYFHRKKPPVVTNLVMHVTYVYVFTHTHTYTHTHLCVSLGEIRSIANIRIHSQCKVHIWFQDLVSYQ